MMKNLMMMSLFTLATVASFASPVCTDLPKSRWIPAEQFQQKLKQDGYQIKKFKEQAHCYEIYGRDKAGNRVEIYFDPVSGKPVKQHVES